MSIPVTDLSPTSRQFKIVSLNSYENPQDEIFCRIWGDKDAGATILMVHGLGAHSGWFEPLAHRLASKGFKTYSFDLAGFGEGKSRKVESWLTWTCDLESVCTYVSENEISKPLILLGNSMGALIVLSTLKNLAKKPDAIVLLSPGFGGYAKTFTLGYKLKAVATALFNPKKVIELPYGPRDITSNNVIRQELENDPEVTFSVPAGLGLELLKLTKHAEKGSAKLPCPLLLTTAGKDVIVDNKLIDKFFEKVESPFKRKEFFEDNYHDLVFESSIDQLVEKFESFLVACDITLPGKNTP